MCGGELIMDKNIISILEDVCKYHLGYLGEFQIDMMERDSINGRQFVYLKFLNGRLIISIDVGIYRNQNEMIDNIEKIIKKIIEEHPTMKQALKFKEEIKWVLDK